MMKTLILSLILSILNLNNSFLIKSRDDSSLRRILREVNPNGDQTTIKTVVTETKPISSSTQPIDEQQRFVRHQNDENSKNGVNSLQSQTGGVPTDSVSIEEPETSDQNIHEIKIKPNQEQKTSTNGSKTQETDRIAVTTKENMKTSSTSISSFESLKPETTSLFSKIVDYLKLKLTEIYLYLISLATDAPNNGNSSKSDNLINTSTSIIYGTTKA